MIQPEVLTIPKVKFIVGKSSIFYQDMIASKDIGELTAADEPKACENTLVKIMKLIKARAGDELYFDIYRQSMTADVVRASYQSQDIHDFINDIYSIKHTIEQRLLGQGEGRNIYEAVNKAKSDILLLMNEGNTELAEQLQATLAYIENSWNQEKEEIRALLTNQLGTLEANLNSQFAFLGMKIDQKQNAPAIREELFQTLNEYINQNSYASQSIISTCSPFSLQDKVLQQSIMPETVGKPQAQSIPSNKLTDQKNSSSLSQVNLISSLPPQNSSSQSMNKYIAPHEESKVALVGLASKFKQSTILISDVHRNFVISNIPSFKKSSKLKLLYKGSQNGWLPSDFHRQCDGKGATICIVRTSKGRILGGFTQASWSTGGWIGSYKEDDSAFLFSVDKQLVLPVKQSQYATYHWSSRGFCFGKEFYIEGDPYGNHMNSNNGGSCLIGGNIYNIPKDEQGNNVLTGQNNSDFSCTKCEVYRVII